jgi:hypothetical protein
MLLIGQPLPVAQAGGKSVNTHAQLTEHCRRFMQRRDVFEVLSTNTDAVRFGVCSHSKYSICILLSSFDRSSALDSPVPMREHIESINCSTHTATRICKSSSVHLSKTILVPSTCLCNVTNTTPHSNYSRHHWPVTHRLPPVTCSYGTHLSCSQSVHTSSSTCV